MIGRRGALRAASGGALGLALSGIDGAARATDPIPSPRPPLPSSLGALAARSGRVFGSAAQVDVLAADPAYTALFAREVRQITGENELKWHRLRPAPDRFDWVPADRLLAFADRHALAVRGHTLVWHENLPDWLASLGRDGDLAGAVDRHIDAVVGRYAGRIPWWDVVNEPVRVEDGASDGLRRSMFRERLGPDYIADTLRRAHAADPGARLAINEYDLEGAGPYFDARRRIFLDLLRRLRDRNAPLAIVGLQSHLKWRDRFDAALFADFLATVASLGFAVHLTELDVGDRGLPAAFAPRDAAVAGRAGAYLRVALAEPAVEVVTVWGLSDRYSWLGSSRWTRRADGSPSRGCAYDAALQPKPLRATLAAAFDGIPARRGA